MHIYVLTFWSYDYESSISMTQVALMTIWQEIQITRSLLNVINVVSYSNYRFGFLAPLDTLRKNWPFYTLVGDENSSFLGSIPYGHFGDPSHRNGRFVVYSECKNIDVAPGYRHFVICRYFSNFKDNDIISHGVNNGTEIPQ